MTSRTVLNLTLIPVLAGLITLAVYELRKDNAPVAAKLTSLDPDQIQYLRLQSTGRADIEMKKIAGRWQMLTPFLVAANQQRIKPLLKIAGAKIIASYPMDQVDPHQLQLDTPTLIFTLDEIILRFGNTEALSGSRYVQQGQVAYLITDRYSHLARVAATKLVMPTLLHSDESITALHLPKLELNLVEGRWQHVGNDGHTNPDHIQQLLDEWRHARAFDIQILDASAHSTQQVRITTQSATILFKLLRTEDELILQRQDLGLQYHFPLEASRTLLKLPVTVDTG